jgi:prepilin-type processing-associated H-X9-DG protein
LGFGDLFGIKSPPMVIPPLNKLREQMAPAGSVIWADEDGWHMRSVTPFPGAELIGAPISALSGGSGALAGAVVLPALVRAREQAQQAQAMSHLKQIGMALVMYSQEHRKYPASFGELVTATFVGPEVFVSPFARKAVPAEVRAAKREDQANWVNENADYAYLGANLKPDMPRPSDTILAYDKAPRQGRMTVLFADGHVESLRAAVALQRIEAQENR